MSLIRTGRRSLCGAAAAVVIILGSLTGCAASPNVADDTSTASPSPTPTSTTADDRRTCAALGDVRTIIFNAYAALNTDRTTQNELNLWGDLASRVLSNMPVADHGPIAAAADAMKSAAPGGQSLLASYVPGADDPMAEVVAACEAAGFTVVVTGFVGG